MLWISFISIWLVRPRQQISGPSGLGPCGISILTVDEALKRALLDADCYFMSMVQWCKLEGDLANVDA